MKTQVLIERLDLSEAIIDADNRTVRQKLIMAGKSKNNRLYREDVLQKASPLFEGRQTYANHPSKDDLRNRPERSVSEITGWITDVTYENGGIWATRHFTRNQAGNDTWSLVQDIVEGRAPGSLLGASINAVGKARKADDGDYLIVEAIEAVNSVDDVTTPAAGGGWEKLVASDSGGITTELLNAMTFEEWFECRPEFTRRLQNEMKAVRQDEAVKAAKVEADRVSLALQEAQTKLEALQAERDAAVKEAQTARRETAIEKALNKVQLPASWKSDLQERMLQADEREWTGIVERDLQKAKAANALLRPDVSGAGQRVHVLSVNEAKPPAVDWTQIKTPEDQKRVLEALNRGELSWQ